MGNIGKDIKYILLKLIIYLHRYFNFFPGDCNMLQEENDVNYTRDLPLQLTGLPWKEFLQPNVLRF